MTPLRPSRETRGPDRYLPHKMLLFAIGAGCAIAGILSGRGWLINASIIVLVIGMVLRFAGRRRDRDDPHHPGEPPSS